MYACFERRVVKLSFISPLLCYEMCDRRPPPPPVLVSCSESRTEGLRYYVACKERGLDQFDGSLPTRIIYVNFEVDLFLYETEPMRDLRLRQYTMRILSRQRNPYSFKHAVLKQIKHLGMTRHVFRHASYDGCLYCLQGVLDIATDVQELTTFLIGEDYYESLDREVDNSLARELSLIAQARILAEERRGDILGHTDVVFKCQWVEHPAWKEECVGPLVTKDGVYNTMVHRW